MNIQIYGSKKSFDTKKAERYFKERKIKYQYIDLHQFGMAKAVFEAAKKCIPVEDMIDRKAKAYTRLYMDYIDEAKREQTLVRLGRRLADKALKTGRKVALEPMNPYERRIIHSALQEVNGVTTVSQGEEPNRHIIIVPERR